MSHLYGGRTNAPTYVHPAWFPNSHGETKGAKVNNKETKPLPQTPGGQWEYEAGARRRVQREKEGRGTENQSYYWETPTPQHNAGITMPPASPRRSENH